MDLVEKTRVKYSCNHDNCHRSFKRKDRLEVHLRTHTGERPFLCGVADCKKTYVSSQSLARHIERVHFLYKDSDKQICQHCGLELSNTTCLQMHIRRFHTILDDGKAYKCTEDGCKEIFCKKKQLIIHREKDHAQPLDCATRFHKCPQDGCGKAFPYSAKLKRHMKVHEGYKCDAEGCTETYKTWTELRKHKADKHSPNDMECHVCHTVFKSRQILVQHLKTHASVREAIICPRDGCTRTFLYRKNLRQHIRAYHEGEQVFNRKTQSKKDVKKRKRTVKKYKKTSTAAKLCGLDEKSQGHYTHELPHKLVEGGQATQQPNDALSSPNSSSNGRLSPRLKSPSNVGSASDPDSSLNINSTKTHNSTILNSPVKLEPSQSFVKPSCNSKPATFPSTSCSNVSILKSSSGTDRGGGLIG